MITTNTRMITRTETASILKSVDNVLILTHRSPDGDTLGSAFALCRALQSLGKSAKIICADILPDKYSYMFDSITEQDFEPEYIVAVDVADVSLLGKELDFYKDKVNLCIDHHGSNTGYAQKLLLEECAACCEIVYDVINFMGVEIDKKIAECIYTGISTDTGCFKYSNTSSQTHIIAAKLMSTGFNFFKINRLMFEIKSRELIDMELKVWEGIEYYMDGKVAVMTLTKDMIEKAQPGTLESIAPMPRQVEGVRCGVTLKQYKDEYYRISIRTGHELNASAICSRLGGGGHVRAAGCSANGTREDVLKKLLESIKIEMDSVK